MEFKKEDLVLLEEYLQAKLEKYRKDQLHLADMFGEEFNENGEINSLYNAEVSDRYYLESTVVSNCQRDIHEGLAEFIEAWEKDHEQQ